MHPPRTCCAHHSLCHPAEPGEVAFLFGEEASELSELHEQSIIFSHSRPLPNLLHPGSAAGTPDNEAAHRVAHRQRVTQNDASSGPPLRAACGATARCSNSKSSSCSETLHCSQVRCTPVHCTPGTPSTANSRLHCDTLRHGPVRCTQEHCVRHNYSGTSGSPCCNALRWALTRCMPVRCALCSDSARVQGLAQQHAALRAGALARQHAGAQVAALQRQRRGGASICCRSLLLPPSLGLR